MLFRLAKASDWNFEEHIMINTLEDLKSLAKKNIMTKPWQQINIHR